MLHLFSGNLYEIFDIDKETGDLTIASEMDSSMIGHYKLELGIHDNGLPPHTVFTVLFIRITEVR